MVIGKFQSEVIMFFNGLVVVGMKRRLFNIVESSEIKPKY